eukprot:213943-Rhodomonas_salina.2
MAQKGCVRVRERERRGEGASTGSVLHRMRASDVECEWPWKLKATRVSALRDESIGARTAPFQCKF